MEPDIVKNGERPAGGFPKSRLHMPADLRRRVGQMVLVGFRGATPRQAQPILRHIAAGSVGAVVLFDVDAENGDTRNVESRTQLRELVSAVKGAGEIPPLVCCDGEGGYYHRLKERYGFAYQVPAPEMGKRNDLAFTHAAATTIASEMADVGVDWNLAPVVDLLDQGRLAVSARRSFSSDPQIVTAHAREFIDAHREVGVLTTAKHFPGVGAEISPYAPGVGERNNQWSDRELEPYRRLEAEGLLDAVMVTRVTHPSLDPDRACCLSPKVVEGLLRAQIGFDGVVVTDAMEMLAIWDVFGFERSVVMAIQAGVDMLLFANQSAVVPYYEDRAPQVVEVIMEALARGELTEERIDQSCARILDLKARLSS